MGINGAPYEISRYEMIDYILTKEKWKNTVKDINNDLEGNIETRHIPIVARVKVRIANKKRRKDMRISPRMRI